MEYYQVWLKVRPANVLRKLDFDPTTSDPIKRPCHDPDDPDKVLDAFAVQDPRPAFFVEDDEIWELLKKHAVDKDLSIADVVAAAVRAHVQPSGVVPNH